LFGYDLIRHCRDEAPAIRPADASPEVRAAAEEAVDAAFHNVCDLLEGFWPLDAGPGHRMTLALGVPVRDAEGRGIETLKNSPANSIRPSATGNGRGIERFIRSMVDRPTTHSIGPAGSVARCFGSPRASSP
jgi:hypothetical protein